MSLAVAGRKAERREALTVKASVPRLSLKGGRETVK